MKKSTRYEMRDTRYENGSALILVVVLTSLLAIVGVMFVMVARVDRIATSGISENKTLDYAVEAVIARISQELVLDVPGVGGQEYYDYPGQRDKWLASLEPHKDGGYKWRQISDVTGYLADNNYDADDVDVDPPGLRKYIPEYPEITLDASGELDELWADADGDGVADSKWIELESINSSKGKPIYAAIRIIDNGGMLNVNTAYKFDPTESRDRIDGSSQTQINLAALSQRGANGSLDNAADDLQDERCGTEPTDLSLYEEKVVWRYYVPDGEYTPFDISDELEMRSRFLLNRPGVDSRVEEVWDHAFQWPNASVPIGSGSLNLNDWLSKVQYDWSEPNAPNDYSYRHIGTTYNMDRIIHPYGGKMVNINRINPIAEPNITDLYNAIRMSFADVGVTNSPLAAQTAVNLVDFRDKDPNVTTLDVNGIIYYGFERPCVYISELAHRFVEPDIGISPLPDSFVYRSYGIELYKPYTEDDYPDANQWQLVIEDYGTFPVDWSDAKSFHAMLFEHQDAPLDVNSSASLDRKQLLQSGVRVFRGGKTISLQRLVGTDWITVDSETVPYSWDVSGGWLEPLSDGIARSIQRDITLHKCIRRLWDSGVKAPTLGSYNAYEAGDSIYIQAHPENEDFTNVGEIGMVFRKGAYYIDLADRPDTIGYSTNTDDEAKVRVNLADPNYQRIFKYLTRFDPSKDGINNDGDGETPSDPDGWIDDEDEPYLTPEWKIPGRININTAPWYVIAQLPWMTDPAAADEDKCKLAQAIVAYRDKLKLEESVVDYSGGRGKGMVDPDPNSPFPPALIREDVGFASVAELLNVTQDLDAPTTPAADPWYDIRRYGRDGVLSPVPLDFSPDIVDNDFEERDVIFARISNLVTVRSDVFTAYILVRIGADGPQKRVMAIFDRSNVYTDDGRVQIVALHAVADPR